MTTRFLVSRLLPAAVRSSTRLPHAALQQRAFAITVGTFSRTGRSIFHVLTLDSPHSTREDSPQKARVDSTLLEGPVVMLMTTPVTMKRAYG